MILRLICPSGHVLDVDSQLAGRKVRCGACGRLLVVPATKGNRAGKSGRRTVAQPSAKPQVNEAAEPPAAKLSAMPAEESAVVLADVLPPPVETEIPATLPAEIAAEPPATIISELPEEISTVESVAIGATPDAEVAALEIPAEATTEVSTFETMSGPVAEASPAEEPLAVVADLAIPTAFCDFENTIAPLESERPIESPVISVQPPSTYAEVIAEEPAAQFEATVVVPPEAEVAPVGLSTPPESFGASPVEAESPNSRPWPSQAFTEPYAIPSIADIIAGNLLSGVTVDEPDQPTVTFARKRHEWESPALEEVALEPPAAALEFRLQPVEVEPINSRADDLLLPAPEPPANEISIPISNEPTASLPAEAGTPAPLPPVVSPFHYEHAAAAVQNDSASVETESAPAEAPSHVLARTVPPRHTLHRTDAHSPTPEQIQTARQVAAAVTTIAAVSLLPTILGGHLNPISAPPWSLWTLLLAIVQIVYAGWLVNAPDWVTARVQMIVAATATTIYAMVMTLLLISPADRPLIFGLGNVRAMAMMWCALMFLLLGGLTLYCGWTSTRWRKALVEEKVDDSYHGRL